MTINDDIEKFKHGVEEAFHEVEEAFNEAKEHMILSVRNHSYMIALLLMSITSAVLVFGTIYVWCYHRGHSFSEEEYSKHVEAVDAAKMKKKKPKTEKNETVSQNDDKNVEEVKSKESVQDVEKLESLDSTVQGIDSNPGKSTVADNNGDVRQRKTSPGTSLNNNDSPVKSRIPVRRQKSKTS
ncbi:uncharacterized protein LOC127880401 [Dreissena polymorpha]|uniref:Uncharacterized protein n=1 Tax=Dreissena polymorpha TaxID=45954 RepID=A0A9D4RWD9_DREPO|nr:uncharacterized protein LOC127880401 [Dreissena polymorpha]KAH3881400.1 hypothetical protein DPMN_005326 [Dreissena polymorpha]